MAEAVSNVKGTSRKNKRDLFATVSTPLNAVKSGKLSLMSTARLNRITSNSFERLSFISEKEDDNDYENYHLEYSKYLLRKIQNRVLSQNKEKQEEKIKKCFVSLKFELEELLEKFVTLSKEIGYFKPFLEIIKETDKKIDNGKKVLKVLEESKFESFMKALSDCLDNTINQLQLLDFDKKLIIEMFDENIFGEGSEIDKCLREIECHISNNKSEVSKIAAELVEIRTLSLENSKLKERFLSVFQQISNEILENNYTLYTGAVKRAFDQREECKNEILQLSLDCDTDFLQTGRKLLKGHSTLEISKFDGTYPVMPNSSSTPQPN